MKNCRPPGLKKGPTSCGRSNGKVMGLDKMWKPILVIFYVICLIVLRVGAGNLPQKFGIYSENLHSISGFIVTTATLHILLVFIAILVVFLGQYFAANFLFVVMTLMATASSLVTLTQLSHHEIPTNMDTLDLVKREIQMNEKIPKWLHQSQLTQQCCGIFGFKDYRAFLYGSNQQKDDVPFSCCYDGRQAKTHRCRPQIQGQMEVKDNDGIVEIFAWTEEEALSYFKAQVNDPLTLTQIEKVYQEDSEYFPLNSTKIGNYHTKGCYEILVEQTMTLYQIYFYGLTLVTLSSWILIFTVGVRRREELKIFWGKTLAFSDVKKTQKTFYRKRKRLVD